MQRNVYASLSQGMDSFLRVAMTLRRKELEVESMSMTRENSGMQLTINDEKTSLEEVVNYMRKLHDITDLKVISFPSFPIKILSITVFSFITSSGSNELIFWL